MMIVIITRLHSDVHGGGENRIHHQWATGPRNLLKAIKCLSEHRRLMESGYGNIGCGRTWLEIDGVEIPQGDLNDILVDDAWAYGPGAPAKMVHVCTQKAKHLLTVVSRGGYRKGFALFEQMPPGWRVDHTCGSPLYGHVFATDGRSILRGGKRALVRVIPTQKQ